MLFNVRFPCLFGVVSRMVGVSPCGMGVMRGLFVLSTFVVLSRFPMMASRFGVML